MSNARSAARRRAGIGAFNQRKESRSQPWSYELVVLHSGIELRPRLRVELGDERYYGARRRVAASNTCQAGIPLTVPARSSWSRIVASSRQASSIAVVGPASRSLSRLTNSNSASLARSAGGRVRSCDSRLSEDRTMGDSTWWGYPKNTTEPQVLCHSAQCPRSAATVLTAASEARHTSPPWSAATPREVLNETLAVRLSH